MIGIGIMLSLLVVVVVMIGVGIIDQLRRIADLLNDVLAKLNAGR